MSKKTYKNNLKKLGNKGEDIACDFLLKNGYKIIERNFNCFQGEIDIIAIDNKDIVFIEVKTRRNMHYGEPIDSINFYKKKHILKASTYYLYINNLYNKYIRFDVIEVYIFKDFVKVNHIKNVELF